MYQLDWSSTPPPASWPGQADERSRVCPRDVEAVSLIEWQEHCIECATPHCYTVCPLYVRRGDGQCARFKYGIYRNRSVRGLHAFGADVSFRRWGKLQAVPMQSVVPPGTAQVVQRLTRLVVGTLHIGCAILAPTRDRKVIQWFAGLRRRWFPLLSATIGTDNVGLHEFLIELRSVETQPFALIVESFSLRDQVVFRAAVPVKPGYNLFRIPAEAMGVNLSEPDTGLYLYPENDAEVRVIFTWLDFVRYRVGVTPPVSTQDDHAPKPLAQGKPPAARVKCVVWDLDDTLWDGILADDGPEGVRLRPQALELIKQFDERGILQSIASKNSHDAAWAVVEKLGLKDYFLYPSISWGPKSRAIASIAEKLNINIDALALIDDSDLERAQVNDVHPQVRGYRDTEMARLLSLDEFDVPISKESRTRRLSYLTEAAREQVARRFEGDHEQFLRSCELEANVFFPTDEASMTRCLELLLRSNQLNLSTRRYNEHELRELLADPEQLCVAVACRDRFGDYGTVGFLAVDLSADAPLLRAFVMSCRVAKKKVENAVFRWLCDRLSSAGHARLLASYLATERNGVLLETLQEAGFVDVERKADVRVLGIDCAREIPASSVVAVRESARRRLQMSPTLAAQNR